MKGLTRPLFPRAARVAAFLVRAWPRIKCAVALAALAVILGWSVLAGAQGGPCLPRADAITKLQRQYHEQQIGIGVASRGSLVIELFVSDSGSWTILMTRADGISCVAAAGENWSTTAAGLESSL